MLEAEKMEAIFGFNLTDISPMGIWWLDPFLENAMGRTLEFETEIPYLYIWFCCKTFMVLLEGYKEMRNLNFNKQIGSSDYLLKKNKFSIFYTLFKGLVVSMMVRYASVRFLYLAEDIVNWLGWYPWIGIPRCLISNTVIRFMCLFVEVPAEIYVTFWLEAEFNKTSKRRFALDLMLNSVLNLVIGHIVTTIVIFTDYFSAGAFPFLVMLPLVLFILLLSLVYGLCLEGMFSKFAPISEDKHGAIKKRIDELAESVGFPADNIFIQDYSSRTLHDNASIGYDFAKRRHRMILSDNMFSLSETGERKYTNDEILGIIAHELGHWKLNHDGRRDDILKVTLDTIKAITMFFLEWQLFMFLRKDRHFYEHFGFRDHECAPCSIMPYLFQMTSPISLIQKLRRAAKIRQQELEADDFAVKQGHGNGLVSALTKMNKNSKHPDLVDPFCELWMSHPQTQTRIERISQKINNKKIIKLMHKEE